MAKIENIDLGTITLIEQIVKKTFVAQKATMTRLMHHSNMILEEGDWMLKGFIVEPTQETIESLRNISDHGLICFVDITEKTPALVGYGKLVQFRETNEDTAAGILYYEALMKMQSAIGLTHIQTSEAYLHDLLYRSKLERFDPQLGRFNKSWSVNRLELTYEFYIDNYKAGTQDLLIEIQCGDDLNKVEVWGWKAAAWSAIGTWGSGGTAWGTAGAGWTDDDAVAHIPTAHKGYRGQDKGIGIVSLSLGCNYRVLLKLTNFLQRTLAHYSTNYGSNQLKLKIKLTHPSREALRPYPHITYIEGGREAGVP